MAVTRSKSYAPGLLGPLTQHRKPTAQQAEKLLAKREAAAMKRYEENRVLAEKLEKERDEAIGEEELKRRKAAVAKIQEGQLEKLRKMAEFLKTKKKGGSRKKTKRSKKTKRRSARK